MLPFLDNYHVPRPMFSILPELILSSEQSYQTGAVFPFADEKTDCEKLGNLLKSTEVLGVAAHVVSFREAFSRYWEEREIASQEVTNNFHFYP